MVAPLPPPPPGQVLPLQLPYGHGSASTSPGQSPRGLGGAGFLPVRLGSSGDAAHPFRLTLLPCKPGTEVDNLMSLAANIFQVGPSSCTCAMLRKALHRVCCAP